jgi:hypothetical protein
MNLGWQDLAALGIVFAAAAYLSMLAWGALTRKSTSGCGSGCGSCSTQSRSALGVRSSEPAQVVSIGALVSNSGKGTMPHVRVE